VIAAGAIVNFFEQFNACLLSKAGHSGYPKNSGQVIRILKIATRFLPQKSITRNFGYPIIQVRVWVLPDIPEIDKTNHFGRIQIPFKTINNSPINHIISSYQLSTDQLSSEHKSTLIHTK
jgi:hypothetical protein